MTQTKARTQTKAKRQTPAAPFTQEIRFSAKLWLYPGPAGWTFVTIPKRFALPKTGPFGRVPVSASVDGRCWATSAWHDRQYGLLLAVPKRMRGDKHSGDTVQVEISLDMGRI